ncbi:MAG: CrcB family protein [Nocardioides sp.]
MTGLLVLIGAGVGAGIRYAVGHLWDRDLPLGTLLVNVVGSLLLGALSAAALDGGLWALLGVGFCGGLTTYSSFAVRTVGLAEQSHARALTYAAATVTLSLAAAFVGFALAS